MLRLGGVLLQRENLSAMVTGDVSVESVFCRLLPRFVDNSTSLSGEENVLDGAGVVFFVLVLGMVIFCQSCHLVRAGLSPTPLVRRGRLLVLIVSKFGQQVDVLSLDINLIIGSVLFFITFWTCFHATALVMMTGVVGLI